MKRFIWYEIKAISRYSSGAKRRRSSIAILIILPFVLLLELRLLYHSLGDYFINVLKSYKILSISLRIAALLGISGGISVGRVSYKAKELIYSSPISNAQLFFALYVVTFFNSLIILVPIIYVAYLLSPPVYLLLFTVLFLYYSLVGFSIGGTARGYKQSVLSSLPFLALLIINEFTPLLDHIEVVLEGSLDTLGLIELLIISAISLPAIPYGVSRARDIISRQEAVFRVGAYRKGSIPRLYLTRYPQLLLLVLLMPAIVAFNVISSGARTYYELYTIIISTSSGAPIITVVMMLYGLSRELGRRDLRLPSPNDHVPYNVRKTIARYSLLGTSAASLLSYVYIGFEAIKLALVTLATMSLPASLGAYYAAGACKPVYGTLNDAFKAPLAKQLTIAILIGMAGMFVTGITLSIALEYNLETIASIALALLAVKIFDIGKKRFLKRARL